MIDAGVCLELIFSCRLCWCQRKMKIIRDLNDEYGYTTAILGDLQGPKLRCYEWRVIVHDGDLITFTTAEDILEQLKSVHEI
jgi:pyruvate kinase